MTDHPARAMSQRSMAAVVDRDKQGWLALWAPDGWIEDPVGVSFLDPTGLGHHGPQARSAFWDANIGSTESIRFELSASFATGNEVCNVATIHLTLPGGATTRCEGVFVYRLNEQGQLLSLRAFWETATMLATLTQPGPGPAGA